MAKSILCKITLLTLGLSLAFYPTTCRAFPPFQKSSSLPLNPLNQPSATHSPSSSPQHSSLPPATRATPTLPPLNPNLWRALIESYPVNLDHLEKLLGVGSLDATKPIDPDDATLLRGEYLSNPFSVAYLHLCWRSKATNADGTEVWGVQQALGCIGTPSSITHGSVFIKEYFDCLYGFMQVKWSSWFVPAKQRGDFTQTEARFLGAKLSHALQAMRYNAREKSKMKKLDGYFDREFNQALQRGDQSQLTWSYIMSSFAQFPRADAEPLQPYSFEMLSPIVKRILACKVENFPNYVLSLLHLDPLEFINMDIIEHLEAKSQYEKAYMLTAMGFPPSTFSSTRGIKWLLVAPGNLYETYKRHVAFRFRFQHHLGRGFLEVVAESLLKSDSWWKKEDVQRLLYEFRRVNAELRGAQYLVRGGLMARDVVLEDVDWVTRGWESVTHKLEPTGVYGRIVFY